MSQTRHIYTTFRVISTNNRFIGQSITCINEKYRDSQLKLFSAS